MSAAFRLPLYASHNENSPAKHISLTTLLTMAMNPTTRPKDKAACLTPFDAEGKTKPYALESSYWALVCDHDDDSRDREEISAIYDSYGCAWLAFTTSSHQQNKKGVTANRWKVVIPLLTPIDSSRYGTICNGLAMLGNADRAQARVQQVFYAPNVIEAGAAYEYIDRTDSPLLDASDDNAPLTKAALTALEDAQATAEAEARPAMPKPRSVRAEDAGVIDKAVAAYDIDSVIEAEGYRRIGRAWLSPNSTTGSAGVHILTGPDGKKRLYSHHGESDPLSNLNHDGHSLDLFDVLVALKYGGDFSRAVRAFADDLDPDGQKRRRQEYAKEKAREETIDQFGASVTPEAQKIADYIHQQLLERFGIDPADDPDAAESLLPNGENITRMINGAFWSGTKSKIFLLNHDESLVQFKETDAYKFLCRTFGTIIDKQAVTDLAKSLAFGCTSDAAEESARAKFISGCMAIALTAILDHLKYANQRESVEWRVDMFAKFSRLELQEDKARIVLTHKPLKLPRRPADHAAIVADYLQHFPKLDAFIELLVAARFAGDRKKAYLWLFASTDWGKGLLLGALSQIGLVVNLSVKEVEAMFEGKPVGRSPLDFKRAFVLAIDEFKTVKAELKQLQSVIELAPKNQLTSSVEVFAYSGERDRSFRGS